ncbi:hypothetical protein L7F22_046374 [Adiantum nelumboides]|nr:hypothetical protein [Adiantum nelumboides]
MCRGVSMPVLVMDVEGSDGRERGEDQDFERKSALFSMASAECLLVNMWEHQVGLYQAPIWASSRLSLRSTWAFFRLKGQEEQVVTNKDLDLPTQQELLAQFRCDEIASVAFGEFATEIKAFRKPIEAGSVSRPGGRHGNS